MVQLSGFSSHFFNGRRLDERSFSSVNAVDLHRNNFNFYKIVQFAFNFLKFKNYQARFNSSKFPTLFWLNNGDRSKPGFATEK